jgi:hypothetical protein
MADVSDARVKWALAGFDALVTAGEDCLGEAVRRTPVEEGTLRASATLGFDINGRLFEGPGAAQAARAYVAALARAGTLRTMDFVVSFPEVYAASQHEGLDFNHPLGGQAKFLESVLLERGNRYVAAAQAAQERAVR